ncbi:hypothetical protein CXB51_009671 [Gossypium anomalum]|uniref:Disease resistance protein At4g27190-like leucine-rich repeats domain-containing protein n=1 Tax=Gossypium anomalum TaxID=47600 RepID=A0A8J6CYQ6_9ROSI|nr:hypothetical protein CXB51_009671 [Gossypium anomalum]
MPCLSVLYLSFTKIESLPNSISELKNLTTLLLCGCEELRDLPCLSMLQELKKLDISGTKIEEVPEGMDMLIKLRYIDLRVRTLKEIPAGLLPKLVHLQHLSFDVNNVKISLTTEEMEPLKKLECFTGCFKDINEFNKFISSMQQHKKNLIKYDLQVGSSFIPATRDKILTIGGVHNWEGELIMHPIEIQELNIFECDYLRSLVDENSINLRDCGIWECEGIECVVSLSSFACSSSHPFQSLEVLVLCDLPKLSALIMKDEGTGSATTSTLAPSATFSHLKKIVIIKCSSMKTLLPHWLLPNLQNLEEISVSHCDERIPPFVPLVGNGQPFAYAPPSLTIFLSTEWWESLEWDDDPNFKNVLQPLWKDERYIFDVAEEKDKSVGGKEVGGGYCEREDKKKDGRKRLIALRLRGKGK